MTSEKEEYSCRPSSVSGRTRLPKITLPRFSGDIMKWTAFWDSYKSAVHSNNELSDVDKFNYLRSLLERTAYEAVAGLTLPSANYAEAVDISEKRFGIKQLIISKHMETLLNMDVVTSDQDLRGLRRLYDGAESHIRSLKALGVDTDSYGTMLSSVFLNKLPPELRLIISRQTSGSAIVVDTLMKIVEEELTARERTAGPASLSRRNHEKDKSKPTSMSLLVTLASASCLLLLSTISPFNRLLHRPRSQLTSTNPQDQWTLFQLPSEGAP